MWDWISDAWDAVVDWVSDTWDDAASYFTSEDAPEINDVPVPSTEWEVAPDDVSHGPVPVPPDDIGSNASSMPGWMKDVTGTLGDLVKAGVNSPTLAGYASGAASFASARETNEAMQRMFSQGMDFNAQQAALNRDFQKDMSSTSWQRGVADMKSAGINPMLAASKGGASTPGGAGASAPSAPSLRNAVGEGVSSATSVAGTLADLENKRETTNVLKSQSMLNAAQASKFQQEEATSAASAGEIKERTREITQRLDTLIGDYNEQKWRLMKLTEDYRVQQRYRMTGQDVEWDLKRAQTKTEATQQNLNYARAELARTDAQYHKLLAQLTGLDMAKAWAYHDYYKTEMGREEPRMMSSARYGETVTRGMSNLGLRLPTGGGVNIHPK